MNSARMLERNNKALRVGVWYSLSKLELLTKTMVNDLRIDCPFPVRNLADLKMEIDTIWFMYSGGYGITKRNSFEPISVKRHNIEAFITVKLYRRLFAYIFSEGK
jgi:hypothetical protein